MGLAHRLQWTLFVVPFAATSTSCIVTSNPVVEPPDDCPASLVASESDPAVGTILSINTIETKNPQFDATVSIRSCAVTSTLEGRVFLDDQLLLTPKPALPNGSLIRQVNLSVSLLGLKKTCHKVEYLVSSRFSVTDFRTPEKLGDLAYGIWWIDLNDGTSNPLGSCPKTSP